MKKLQVNAVFVISVLFSSTLLALSSDREQPIEMEADQLEVNDKTRISRYSGNVTMTQGSIRFEGDSIEVKFDPAQNLQSLEINGAPARFRQLTDQQQLIDASALKFNYFANTAVLELRGNAVLKSGTDTIESEFITINTDTNEVTAGDQKTDSRVRMVIQPNTSSTTNE